MRKLYIFYILLLFASYPLQAKQFYFKKYQVDKGLSHNTVWCILQDSYGFMWFGTTDGLNRFDGQRFVVYRNDIQDSSSLGNNYVQTLFEDDDRNIWIGTNSGIYIYNRKTDNFSHFNKKTKYEVSISGEITKIIKTQKGQIWIATLGQGLFIYDPQTQELVQNSKDTSFSWDLCEDKNSRIHSSSLQEGLISYDQNGNKVNTYTSFLEKKDLSNIKINCTQAIEDKVWFSIGVNNLNALDTKTKQIQSFSNNSLHIGTIKAIIEYSDQDLLIGSDNGLYLFNTFTETFHRVDNPFDNRSLSDQSIHAIVKDKEGGIWIATYLGGVNYLAQQTKVFDYYPPTYDTYFSTGKIITQFCEDNNKNIWVGAQDGLKLLNRKTESLQPYTISASNKKYDIRSLLIDNDNLWIGTYSDGLKRLNLKTNNLTEYYHIRESAQSICSNDVLSLYKDRKGDIYIGTTWGLCKYNKEQDNFETLNFVGSMTSVSDLHEDKSGYLWIATNSSGVFRYNSQTREWKHYSHEDTNLNSITSNSVIRIFEDSNGIIWFGTNGGGLCSFNKEDESFKDFDPQNMILPNKVIYSIEEDNRGNFWISSNAGLLRINPETKNNKKLFTQEDGLQSNQFNFKASLKTSSGELYFGGINGFNSFFPNDFKENNYLPPIYVVDVRLYNTTESESKELLQLTTPVYLTEKIELPHNKNSITVEFKALSYEEPGRNKYAYILEGFDKDWVNNDHSNIASYTNLSSGEYTLRIIGSNNDSKWNEDGTAIHITILPPWWRTTIAYLIYSLCLFTLLYFIFRFLAHRSNLKFKKQLEEYRLEKEKEVYQSKIGFFINLVHEIRTPLSLIKLPLEKLSEQHNQDEKESKYLTIINKNVTYLLNIVNQLLDFQKVDSNKSVLKLQELNINLLLQDIYNQFSHSANLNNITMSLSLPDDEIITFVDKEKIIKIANNLLSNALKFANSKIELQLKSLSNSFEIRVLDDGPGIPNSEKEKIFEAFYQAKMNSGNSAKTGTGIGLTFSRLLAENHRGTLTLKDNEWGGSSFVLTIPTEYEEYDLLLIEFITSFEEKAMIISTNEENKGNEFFKNKVLLVEDNVDLLNLIEDSLNSHFTIFKAENGRQALEIVSKENIDLIVSDIMMPDIDGLELTKSIKSDMNYSHIPVILLTAKTTLESKIEGLEYGADVYIEKPFSIRFLHKQIENLLKLRQTFQKMITSSPSLEAKIEAAISKKDREFIEKLHVEIENHIAELDFSIDNIAETMFMSRSSFYRKVKSITGMSPNDYLKVFRLNKAAELLLENNLPISEICDQVAFSSSSYFAKCFKAQFGVLPKDYVTDILNKKKNKE